MTKIHGDKPYSEEFFLKGCELNMGYYHNKKGYLLIEIIIGITLFGLISVSLIPILTNQFIHINRSGRRTEALYDNQKTIETNSALNLSSQNITITFDRRSLDINVDVFKVEDEYDKNGSKATIGYFKANLSGL